MSQRIIFVIALLLCAVASPAAQDHRIVGAWKAVTYEINGTPHPMQGLFIFTKNYYSANVRFKLGSGPIDEANGNAGPYKLDSKQIVFTQWVQIHVRPGDEKQPVLSREGPDEASDYKFEGNRLILTFPSKNCYILERVSD
jgi:hypothetical protein